MDDWATSLKQSSLNFNEYFRDIVLAYLHGDLEVVEGVTKYEMAKTLDMLAGIDLWHFNTKHGVRGVANRIQSGKCWQTFTVRKSRASGARTEYEKRKYAIENEFLYPVITLQGYLDKENDSLCFAIAKTKDILWMIDNGFFYIKATGKNQIGQASFFVVRWKDMKKRGFKIHIHKDSP